jgi:hypothetical protein
MTSDGEKWASSVTLHKNPNMNILTKLQIQAKKRFAKSLIYKGLKRNHESNQMSSDPKKLSTTLVDDIWRERESLFNQNVKILPRSVPMAALALAVGLETLDNRQDASSVFSVLSDLLYLINNQNPKSYSEVDMDIFKEVGKMYSRSIEKDKERLCNEFSTILKEHGISFDELSSKSK